MRLSSQLISDALARWVGAVQRRPRAVVSVTGLLTLLLLGYALTHLRINSDNVQMVAEHLPSRQNHEAFAKLFPNLENALLIVVDGETPELARDAAVELTDRLAATQDMFTEVYLPGGGDFFERNSLLYRDVDELYEFADQIARVQPLLAELERDGSIAKLASLVQSGLDAVGDQPQDISHWVAVLERVGHATVEVYSEYPLAVSWEELLLRGSPLESVRRRVIVAHPVLDFDNVFAARKPMELIRSIAAESGYTAERGVSVRITGNPALNYEEMIGIAWDVGVAGLFCFAMVVGILILALRSMKLVVSAVAALLVGLVWTAAFAAASIGSLNLVSVTFAVLFIGLGVDFGIHLCMRFADAIRSGAQNTEAQTLAVREVGGSLALCTLTTATGFFVFVPTDYRGVAELGLISGAGMFIILFQTLTLIPALLSSWLRVDAPEQVAGRVRFHASAFDALAEHGSAVRRTAAVLGIGALCLLPGIRFDQNVVNMRDPGTESVQAFNDLLDQSGFASPWFVNAVAADLDAADELSAQLAQFESVAQSVTLTDYVPLDQDEKREILTDIAYFLPEPDDARSDAPRASTEEQIAALRALHGFLARAGAARGESPLAKSMRVLRGELGEFLQHIDDAGDPEPALRGLETVLLSGFPSQMERLRVALDPVPVDVGTLPETLVSRMLTADGRARVQIYPRDSLADEAAFVRFVGDVRTLAPDAAGVAINLVEFAEATQSSFRQALVSAILAIAFGLWLLWRSTSDVLLVLAPLLLSSVLTCGVIVALDLPFNFANVIVIPLLLGIGVDSGIHLVHRAKHLGTSDTLLGTTTARAVFFSAITTAVSFGTLALSSHRGMASLGIVLTVGMFFTIVCNLVVLPALIDWRGQRARADATQTPAPLNG